MRLITFQSMDALRVLINEGYLETDRNFVEFAKVGNAYGWIVEKMNQSVPNVYGTAYPLWCWVKFKNGICPPKHRGKPVKGFDVKITFRKEKQDVFITDYRRYSFLLNNRYIPENLADKVVFEREQERYGITDEELLAYVRNDKFQTHREDADFLHICERIRRSFDRCITEESDVLQGCIWRLNLDEVEKIEFLTDEDYSYGTFNYVRRDGKRFDWIGEFYGMLKDGKFAAER